MSDRLYMHRVVLLNEQGEKLTEETLESGNRMYPQIIECFGDYYLYSHDSLVGDERLRTHYYKPTLVVSIAYQAGEKVTTSVETPPADEDGEDA